MNRTDFLDTDNFLDEEERSIGNAVRDHVNAEPGPFVAEWYERGNIPIEIAKGPGTVRRNQGVVGLSTADAGADVQAGLLGRKAGRGFHTYRQ